MNKIQFIYKSLQESRQNSEKISCISEFLKSALTTRMNFTDLRHSESDHCKASCYQGLLGTFYEFGIQKYNLFDPGRHFPAKAPLKSLKSKKHTFSPDFPKNFKLFQFYFIRILGWKALASMFTKKIYSCTEVFLSLCCLGAEKCFHENHMTNFTRVMKHETNYAMKQVSLSSSSSLTSLDRITSKKSSQRA